MADFLVCTFKTSKCSMQRVCVYVCVSMCVHVCIHVCVCVCVCMHACLSEWKNSETRVVMINFNSYALVYYHDLIREIKYLLQV